MWHLSNSCPPDADSTWKKELKSRQKASEDDYAENKEDWAAILAEGEQRWDGCGSGDDALSEWSGEEDLDDNDLEERKSDGRRRDDKKKPARMKLDERKDCCKKVNVDSAERRLRSAMQPEYWKEGGLTMPVPSRKETAHFVQLVDRAMEAQGAPVAVKTKLTEYQLLRECLWMVRRPPDKSTFAFRLGGDGRYTLRGDICLASVTAEALSRSLEYLLSFLSHLKEIMDFVDEVYANDSVSYTYEAYASCLADFLQLLSADLLRLETRVYKQEMTLTLFDLEKELTPWAKTVYALHACHRRSVVRPLDEQYCPNWRRAVKLLSGIFLCMHVTHNDTTHELILDLFLKSLVPYLRIIGLWLTEGRLEDYRDEFVFKQRAGTASAVEEEKFWKEGFEVRPYLEALAEDGLRLPSMLEKALPKILVGGKSIEILALLGKKNNRYGGPNLSDAVLCSREDLFRKFVENLKTELKMPKEPERGDAYTASSDRGNVAFFDSGIDECDDIDPYLKMAFEEVYKAAAEEGEASDVSTSVRSAFILPSSVDPLLPLTSVLERSLLPPVFDHYRLSCEALVRTVKETLSLDRHLGAVRRVFLMEAGDVLFEFYSELFGRMQDDGEAGAVEEAMLDSTSITLLLQVGWETVRLFGKDPFLMLSLVTGLRRSQLSRRGRPLCNLHSRLGGRQQQDATRGGVAGPRDSVLSG
jgi:gamma-tubulin complex component 5